MNDLKIVSKSKFIPELSDIEKSIFLFSYKIKIINNGNKQVQLMSRHWDIEDSSGITKKVDGQGVVGEQPIIDAGSFFEYRSFCPLSTSFGYMEGFYTLKEKGGDLFKVSIPKFGLIPPNYIN